MIHDAWTLAPAPDGADALPSVAHPAIRSILLRRGVNDGDSYRRFIAPNIGDLHDPASIHGMAHACERIARAIRDRETILIYGDYDVDGVTSIVLLQTVLRALGADADFVVPHRLFDGYGLKIEVLDRVLADRNVKLVITVDCGITSVEPVQRAIERGIDVIITDHHLPPGVLPEAAAVLNPKQPGCNYPFKELAGVGVAFKLCCMLLQQHGKTMSVESLLKIAAIGTIADVAPLVGENRTIARLGLDGLSDPRNPGLRALIRRLGLLGRPLRARDVGFKIGPRLNAAGRLASANTAIELFRVRDEESAWTLVLELDRMNAERQQIEHAVRLEAEKQIAGDEKVLVLAAEAWHKGVLGLAAGRLAQAHHRPALVIAIEGDRCVGSGRSIPTINLHERLEMVSDLFTHFGGHEFACGFSFPTANLAAIRERLAAAFESLDDALFRREACVDAELVLGDINRDFLAAHEQLQPFGAGNLEPLFAARGVEVAGSRTFAPDCFELTLRDATGRATAVLWPSVKKLQSDLSVGCTVDLLFHVEPDTFAPSGVRLSIVDAMGCGGAQPRNESRGFGVTARGPVDTMQEQVIKVLRIALPIVFIAFVGLIVVSWRRGGVRKGKEDTNPVVITRPEKPQSEVREFDETQSIAGRMASHIHAKRVVSYTSNWNTLEDVELTIYRPSNLTYKLVCPQAQVNTQTKEADAKGGVRVTSGDGIEITTAEIHFDGNRLTNHIPMQFRIDRWSGTAGALDLDVQGEILRLYEKVDATMAPEQPGESPLNLKGQEGVWRRKEGDVTVTQNVVMTRLADNVSADKMLARFTPDRKQIVGLEGEGHVVMNMSAPPPPGPGAAPSEDLGGAKHLYCDKFNSELGPDGKISAMNAVGDPGTAHAVIDGPPGRDMVAKSFRVGLSDKVVTDIKAESQVVLHETGEIPRETTTDHLTVLFDRASHQAATAILEGNVRYKDPKNQAQAVHANYDIIGDRVVLTAEPGFDPTVVSDGQTVKAKTIEFSPKGGTAKATGDVIAQLISKQNGGASADSTTIFPANKPVFVNSDLMTSRQSTKTAVFTGNVRAWQDTNTLFANEVQVQGAGDQITARGNARTVLYNMNTADKKVSTIPMQSRSDQLLAWKNERRIELLGSVKIEDDQRTMTGEHATIYFDANRKMEHVDAEKNVILIDRPSARKGTGEKATYNVAKKMVYMMGTATAVATVTSPNGMIKGQKIAFDLARNKVDVVSPDTPTEGVYKPDAKP